MEFAKNQAKAKKQLELHPFLMSNAFTSNAWLKFAKNEAKANQHPEGELLLFENYLLASSMFDVHD